MTTKNKVARISLKNVVKSFGSKHVLEGLTLDIEPGQSIAIIGGSGTGKSVAIKCILGLMRLDAGDILIDGNSVLKMSEKDHTHFMQRCGVLFQGSALFDSLKVWENVAFGLIYSQNMPLAQAKEIALKNLTRVGLEERVADLYPAEISGGMQRRVALARAVAPAPEILFFDEPTTGLDPIMSGVINELIRRSVEELGATAITITHDMASVRKIADRVAMLYQGKLLWQGTVAEMDATDDPYIQQFIKGRTEGPIPIEK